jgi:hypothetical protein
MFELAVTAPDGRRYYASAEAEVRADQSWEGWIEFEPVDGSAVLRSPRQMTCRDLMSLQLWAAGLTHGSLQAVFARTWHASVGPHP